MADACRGLMARLDGMLYLGAKRYAENSEPGMRTFSAYMENVFVRFYEWKSRLLDGENVPKAYRDDWEGFLRDVQAKVAAQTEFVGICPVMYLKIYHDVANGCVVVENFLIRPCAVGFGFLTSVMKCVAGVCVSKNWQLKVTIPKIRALLLDRVVQKIEDEAARVGVVVKTPTDMWVKTTLVPSSKGVDGVDGLVYELTKAALKRLSEITLLAVPEANELATFVKGSSKDRLMREMYDRLPASVQTRMTLADDDVEDIPPYMKISDTVLEQLVVYKGGYRYGFQGKSVIVDETREVMVGKTTPVVETRTSVGWAANIQTVVIKVRCKEGVEAVVGQSFGVGMQWKAFDGGFSVYGADVSATLTLASDQTISTIAVGGGFVFEPRSGDRMPVAKLDRGYFMVGVSGFHSVVLSGLNFMLNDRSRYEFKLKH